MKDALGIADTMRKVAGLKAKRVTELSLGQVFAWLRAQESDIRDRVARELANMGNRKGGVLG